MRNIAKHKSVPQIERFRDNPHPPFQVPQRPHDQLRLRPRRGRLQRQDGLHAHPQARPRRRLRQLHVLALQHPALLRHRPRAQRGQLRGRRAERREPPAIRCRAEQWRISCYWDNSLPVSCFCHLFPGVLGK